MPTLHRLSFLDDRNYLHGTTLLAFLWDIYKPVAPLSFKISKKIYSDSIWLSEERGSESAASLHWSDGGMEKNIFVCEAPLGAMPERCVLDEDNIVSRASFSGNTVTCRVSRQDFISTVVVVSKELHRRVCQNVLGKGQRLFVRLDLEIVPQEESAWDIVLMRYAQPQLTCAHLFQKGCCAGKIYFSWQKV